MYPFIWGNNLISCDTSVIASFQFIPDRETSFTIYYIVSLSNVIVFMGQIFIYSGKNSGGSFDSGNNGDLPPHSGPAETLTDRPRDDLSGGGGGGSGPGRSGGGSFVKCSKCGGPLRAIEPSSSCMLHLFRLNAIEMPPI